MLSFIQNRVDLIKNTDPNRIYLENVRSFFNVPLSFAKLLCEMAVKENYFKKDFGYKCPNCDRIIITNSNSTDKEEVSCLNCELNEEEIFTFKKNELQKIEFFKLNK